MMAALNRLVMAGEGYCRIRGVTTPAPASLDAALAAVRARAGEIFAHTCAWVEVNSYTENVEGVNAVGALLDQAFALPSLEARIVPSARFGAHRFWRTAAPGAPILLVGHHDTVFPPGHFEGWREDGNGRAVGPGALDMKGGLAIVRAALAALDEVGVLARLPVVVASVADEEVGSVDSRPHLEQAGRGAACALVFESGRVNDSVVTRRRGVGSARVSATGKAAHAGNAHQEGVNAIWAIARFVDAAQRLTDYGRGLTVNVGQVKGGTSKNTVPEHAECALDLRFETVADATALMTGLERALAEATAAVPGVRLALEGGPNRLPMERSAASGRLYDEYAACARAAGLGADEMGIVGGGSDANTLSALGVPSIDALGPRGAGFHTTHEYVELASFVPKAEALVRFLWGRLAAEKGDAP
jgi:glutamate carboxypeptidase